MKSFFVTVAGLIGGGVLALFAAPAFADSNITWSVTASSGGYYRPPVVVHRRPVTVYPPAVVVHSPPVVVYSQPRFAYGAPPHVPIVVYGATRPGHARFDSRQVSRHWRHDNGHHGRRHFHGHGHQRHGGYRGHHR